MQRNFCQPFYSSFGRVSTWVRHKQHWSREFILLLFQTAVLSGSDAGSDDVDPASGFATQTVRPCASCVRCMEYAFRPSSAVCSVALHLQFDSYFTDNILTKITWARIRDIFVFSEYFKSKSGMVKLAILILGCMTLIFLYASGVRCYHPDGCNAARFWVASAFFYCLIGSIVFMCFRLSQLSLKIGKFKEFDFAWSVFACVNYWIASFVLSCYLKCVSYGYSECALRFTANLFGYIIAFLYTFEVFYHMHSKQI